jgi:hypothetical protein
MAILSFTVAYAQSLEAVSGLTPNTSIYVEDLGNCDQCVENVGSCWACITTEQQVFTDENLATPVSNGYYMVNYGEGYGPAVWNIVDGLPQSEGFYNPATIV